MLDFGASRPVCKRAPRAGGRLVILSTTLAKKIGTATRQRAQARDLSSMHVPVVDVRACFNFFGQGSRMVTHAVTSMPKTAKMRMRSAAS